MTKRITGNWIYKDEKGNDLIRIKRQEDEIGNKDFLPEDLKTGQYKMPINNRPLYNLHLLKNHQEIIFVEGEKCAQALTEKGFMATTCMGGSNTKTDKTDFTALTGKDIIIWPDNDDAGLKYSESIYKACFDINPKSLSIIKIPEKYHLKWDAADAIEENINIKVFLNQCERYTPKTSQDYPDVILTNFNDIEMQPISWLWEKMIAFGKISMIGGQPGLGKSQITASLAASVTNDIPFPDGTKCSRLTGVIFLSAEDDPADTIKPRLIAANADISKISMLTAIKYKDGEYGFFNLEKDIGKLEKILSEQQNIGLIIIDPISAYLGKTDSHNNAEIRGLLMPLTELAARYNVAILLVTHFNKSQSMDTVERFTGSIGIVGAARAGFAVSKDPDPQKDRRLFWPAKNNIGNDKYGYSYDIEEVKLDNGITTSKIKWNDIPVLTKDIISPPTEKKETQINGACEFLLNLLSVRPRWQSEIMEEAEGAGYSKSAIQRAKIRINAKHKKDGMKGGWIWYLEGQEDALRNMMNSS